MLPRSGNRSSSRDYPAASMRNFIFYFSIAASASISSFAQQPAVNPSAPVPGLSNSNVRLQFPNSDVREVLSLYELLTKKRIVTDNQVTGTVSIVVAGEIPKEEAIRIIEINLLLNGITLIPVENSNIVKVVGTKNPRSAAIPIISDELLIPTGEQVVTFIAKLRYADPTELQQTLTSFVGQSQGGYTNITALPKAQALLITENSATIRGLVHILHEIDVPPAEVVSEFISLERADASDVLDKLKAIFEKQPTNGGSPGAVPVARATPAGTTLPAGTVVESVGEKTVEIRAGSLSEDSIIAGKIKLTADVRTNRIHVVTRPVNMAFVRKLISEFDATGKFGEPVSRPLRYVSVADVLDVVVQAITEPGMKQETIAGGTSKPSQAANNQGNNNSSGGGNFNGGGNGNGSLSVSEGLSTAPVDTVPEGRVVGTTKIIADKNANAIIVIGGEDVKTKVFRLLDHLDQRIPQVMLNTIIGELNLDQKDQFGVDYILRNSGLGLSPIVLNGGNGSSTASTGNTSTSTGTGAAATGTGNGGTSTTGTSGRATDLVGFNGSQPVANLSNLLNQNTISKIATIGGGGITGYVTAGNSLTAIVTALQNTNRFRVVSRPSVFTRNNKKAIIASGQEIAVPTSIQSALNSTNNSNGIVTNSSVQFKNVTLQLEVVPLINSDREVSLDILQKEDEVSGSTRIDNNDIPNIATRYVRTSVTVPNQATLVLGGLIKQSINHVKSGVPVLSNIPVLGYLFSNTTKEKIRTELVILIRPEVSWAPPEANQIRQRAEEFLNIPPNLESTIYPPNRISEGQPIPFRTTSPAKPSAKAGTRLPVTR